MTRRKAIRKWYVWWCGGSAYEVRKCSSTTHPLYPYRSGKMPEGKTPKDREKAIQEWCLMCAGNQAERRNCSFTDCPLWEFRSGRRVSAPIGGTGEQTKAKAGSCMAEEGKALKGPHSDRTERR
jgi:hypothetical protein